MEVDGDTFREHRRAVGVLLASLLFVLYPFHFVVYRGRFAANLSYGDPVVGLIVVLWLLGAVGARRLPTYTAYLGAFVVAAVLSLLANAVDAAAYFHLADGLLAVGKFLGGVAWMVAVAVLYRTFGFRAVRVGLALSVGAATLLALGTLYASLFVADRPLRASGPFANPNLYGNYLFVHVFLALYLRANAPPERRVRTLLTGSVPLLLIALVNTGSRGSLLALAAAVAAAVAFVVATNRVALQRVVAVLGGVAAAALLPAAYNPEVVGRIFDDQNVEIRLRLWRASLEALYANPVFGIGYGQTRPYLARTIGEYRGAHNTYLLVGGETGLVGVAIFLGFLLVVFRDGLRASRDRTPVVFLWCAFVGTLLQGAVTDVDNFRSLWIVVGLIAAHRPASPGSGAFDASDVPGASTSATANDDATAAVDDRAAVANDATAAVAAGASTTGDESAKPVDRASTTSDEASTTGDETSTMGDERSTADDKASTTDDEASTTDDEASTTDDERSTADDDRARRDDP